MPNCSGNGVCVEGECHCWRGYTGPYCSLVEPVNVTVCSPHCSGRGVYDMLDQNCSCAPGWTGSQCEIGEWGNLGRFLKQRITSDGGVIKIVDVVACTKQCEQRTGNMIFVSAAAVTICTP